MSFLVTGMVVVTLTLGEYTDCNHPIGKTYTIKLQVLDHFICMHLVYLVEAVY